MYILGYRSVYDVTKGKSHYGSGGGYNHFAGRFVFVLSIYVDWRDSLICFLYIVFLHVSR